MEPDRERIYLSLGSNLGDRRAMLQEAIRLLKQAGVATRRCSSVWETAPQEVEGQPRFLNLVLESEAALEPEELLDRIAEIEAAMGRRRERPKGPRPIDIDILLWGARMIRTARLEVPHPRMDARRFVLAPLSELAPELEHPVLGVPVRELLEQVQDQEARIFASPIPLRRII